MVTFLGCFFLKLANVVGQSYLDMIIMFLSYGTFQLASIDSEGLIGMVSVAAIYLLSIWRGSGQTPSVLPF